MLGTVGSAQSAAAFFQWKSTVVFGGLNESIKGPSMGGGQCFFYSSFPKQRSALVRSQQLDKSFLIDTMATEPAPIDFSSFEREFLKVLESLASPALIGSPPRISPNSNT